jgi:hypothetical protein
MNKQSVIGGSNCKHKILSISFNKRNQVLLQVIEICTFSVVVQKKDKNKFNNPTNLRWLLVAIACNTTWDASTTYKMVDVQVIY